VTSGTPTKKVPVNSSSDSRKTKMALAMSPGAASGSVIVRKHVQGDAPRLRAASSSDASTCRERRRGDPHGEDEPVRRVHEHDADDRAVEADLVEHARDVDVDRHVRHGCGSRNSSRIAARNGSLRRRARSPAGIATARLTMTVSTAIQMLVPSD
jgi:hypothetical protein